jgi:hypothetical protein
MKPDHRGHDYAQLFEKFYLLAQREVFPWYSESEKRRFDGLNRVLFFVLFRPLFSMALFSVTVVLVVFICGRIGRSFSIPQEIQNYILYFASLALQLGIVVIFVANTVVTLRRRSEPRWQRVAERIAELCDSEKIPLNWVVAGLNLRLYFLQQTWRLGVGMVTTLTVFLSIESRVLGTAAPSLLASIFTAMGVPAENQSVAFAYTFLGAVFLLFVFVYCPFVWRGHLKAALDAVQLAEKPEDHV